MVQSAPCIPAYESFGETRPTLVLVHGYPLDRRMWRVQTDFFQISHRVVSIDLPGFGESRLADASGRAFEFSMASLADACAECLDQAGVSEPVVFCGLSMGGYVGLEFWRRHPSRLQALILSNTRVGADSPAASANRRLVAERVIQDGTEAVVLPMLEKLLCDQTRLNAPEVVEELKRMMLSVKPETIHAAQTAMSLRSDFESRLSEIGIPCLVVAGESDVIVPATEMQSFANRMPNANFVVVPQSGHLSPMENPTAFNVAVERFLLQFRNQ